MHSAMNQTQQNIIIAGIAIVAIVAASQSNWGIVSTILTGAFALLHPQQGGSP